MPTLRWLLALPLILLFKLESTAQAGVNRQMSSGDLWFDVSLGAPLVEWFNRTAQPNDIARIDHLSDLALLDDVQAGRRLVVFKSIAEAEQYVLKLSGKLDIIGYNLEHGPANPQSEQNDPMGSVLRMHELAHRYNMKLAFGPDRAFALSDGVAIAPYVDQFILQVQRVQTEPQTVYDYVLPLVARLKRANPALEVSIQIAAEGEIAPLGDLIQLLENSLDGVSILTDHNNAEIVAATVALFRSQAKSTPPLTPSPTTTTPATMATPSPSVSTVPIASPAPVETIRSPTPASRFFSVEDGETQLPWVAMSILAGIVVLGLVVTIAIHVGSRFPIR